jgi:hypothetical protein
MARLRAFREHNIHVLGSVLSSSACRATTETPLTRPLPLQSARTSPCAVRVAHAVPGTVGFEKWAAHEDNRERRVHRVPIIRHWLIPKHQRPKLYSPHPVMSLADI